MKMILMQNEKGDFMKKNGIILIFLAVLILVSSICIYFWPVKVETFSDLSLSKIYISVFGDDAKKKSIVSKLNENKKTIRFELAQSMNLRAVPVLDFFYRRLYGIRR